MQSIITFANKVALDENADIPAVNKIRDVDINEIKTIVNDSLQGKNAMGSIVVDDVKCKNMLQSGIRQGNTGSTSTANRLFTMYSVKVESGKTYTVSTNLNTTNFQYAIRVAGNPFPVSSGIFYSGDWKTTTSETWTATADGYLGILIAKTDPTANISPSDIGTAYFQVEVGTEATAYTPYKAFATEYKWDVLQNQDVVFTNSTQFFSIQNINKYDRIRVAVNNSYNRTFYFYFEKNDLIGNSNLFQTLLSMPNGELASLALGRITLDVVNDAIGVVYDKSNATFPLTLKNIVGYYRGEQTSSSTSGTRMLSVVNEEEEENR